MDVHPVQRKMLHDHAQQLGVIVIPDALAATWLRPATEAEITEANNYTRALTGRTRSRWRNADWTIWARAMSVIKHRSGLR